jgi:D-inositol-3-phosphate glycosyltransferase
MAELAGSSGARCERSEVAVALLTGGTDRHYAFGLAMALIAKDVRLEVIGSDLVDSPEMHTTPGLSFLNLQGSMEPAGLKTKIARSLSFYYRLVRYAWSAKPRVFHILWNNKLEFFDRTLLMLYYKLLGKKVVFTAHNINAGRRDSSNSLLNRLSLTAQYRLADHIFVHTDKMKVELIAEFGLCSWKVTTIPFGINNAVPDTALTCAEARHRLGLGDDEKAILFFGAIKQYKGLEHLVAAFRQLGARDHRFRLIVAGEPKKGHERYFAEIQEAIGQDPNRDRILLNLEFVPDEETEIYFKAADVAVLPYTSIFQSGILFLAYSFGLPVVAADVGSFREDIVEGRTGFICQPCDAGDLARTLERYFDSDLFRNLAGRRQEIREYARSRNSWDVVGNITRQVYEDMVSG